MDKYFSDVLKIIVTDHGQRDIGLIFCGQIFVHWSDTFLMAHRHLIVVVPYFSHFAKL